MHVSQFLYALLRSPYIEVVETSLPEWSAQNVISRQPPNVRINPLVVGQQCASRALFQHLHHSRRTSDVRFGDEQVNVFRHDDVSDNYEPVALPGRLQNRKEAIAARWCAKKRQAVITGTSNEVQMMSAVRAMQAAGHYKRMLSAVSHPALAKS